MEAETDPIDPANVGNHRRRLAVTGLAIALLGLAFCVVAAVTGTNPTVGGGGSVNHSLSISSGDSIGLLAAFAAAAVALKVAAPRFDRAPDRLGNRAAASYSQRMFFQGVGVLLGGAAFAVATATYVDGMFTGRTLAGLLEGVGGLVVCAFCADAAVEFEEAATTQMLFRSRERDRATRIRAAIEKLSRNQPTSPLLRGGVISTATGIGTCAVLGAIWAIAMNRSFVLGFALTLFFSAVWVAVVWGWRVGQISRESSILLGAFFATLLVTVLVAAVAAVHPQSLVVTAAPLPIAVAALYLSCWSVSAWLIPWHSLRHGLVWYLRRRAKAAEKNGRETSTPKTTRLWTPNNGSPSTNQDVWTATTTSATTSPS